MAAALKVILVVILKLLVLGNKVELHLHLLHRPQNLVRLVSSLM
jgi:hypothetical protein